MFDSSQKRTLSYSTNYELTGEAMERAVKLPNSVADTAMSPQERRLEAAKLCKAKWCAEVFTQHRRWRPVPSTGIKWGTLGAMGCLEWRCGTFTMASKMGHGKTEDGKARLRGRGLFIIEISNCSSSPPPSSNHSGVCFQICHIRPRKSQPPDLHASVCIRCFFFATCAQREASAKSGVRESGAAFRQGTEAKVTPLSSIVADWWGDETVMSHEICGKLLLNSQRALVLSKLKKLPGQGKYSVTICNNKEVLCLSLRVSVCFWLIIRTRLCWFSHTCLGKSPIIECVGVETCWNYIPTSDSARGSKLRATSFESCRTHWWLYPDGLIWNL